MLMFIGRICLVLVASESLKRGNLLQFSVSWECSGVCAEMVLGFLVYDYCPRNGRKSVSDGSDRALWLSLRLL
ncbi:hypothetical protein M758_8G017300 [Ceratodon purpureus]|uniref:Secreted protein n=1 Tax=Ceratodon purpureus TaxID=3225 RepID=A0A8T0GWJ5_CERPU|nr:hypothetical protein KC19_8G017900 [Ceratodon purpureus]KAG0607295.1 hypothetical protein M758_8G017300 [Ceratodon purpureus]